MIICTPSDFDMPNDKYLKSPYLSLPENQTTVPKLLVDPSPNTFVLKLSSDLMPEKEVIIVTS